MVSGSLLNQVIYPDSYADFADWFNKQGGIQEGMVRLEQILRMVHLEYLPQREGGWLIRRGSAFSV